MTDAEILQKYEPLARKWAWSFRWTNIPLEDLQQTAREGMLKAISRYDPEKHESIGPCLAFGAREALGAEVRRTAFPVSIKARTDRRILNGVHRAMRESKTVEEAAQRLGAPVERVEAALGILQPVSQPDTTSDASEEPYGEDLFHQSDLWTELSEAMCVLSDVEVKIVLDFYRGKKRAEIAEEIGSTPESVKTRKNNAVAKLRAKMKDRKFEDFFRNPFFRIQKQTHIIFTVSERSLQIQKEVVLKKLYTATIEVFEIDGAPLYKTADDHGGTFLASSVEDLGDFLAGMTFGASEREAGVSSFEPTEEEIDEALNDFFYAAESSEAENEAMRRFLKIVGTTNGIKVRRS